MSGTVPWGFVYEVSADKGEQEDHFILGSMWMVTRVPAPKRALI